MSAVFKAHQLVLDTFIGALDTRESLEQPSLLQLPCITCGAGPELDCACDELVIERCETCWHFLQDCECCDDDECECCEPAEKPDMGAL